MNLRRSALGVSLAIATAPAGCAGCFGQPKAIVTIPLDVGVHRTATLPAGDADAIALRSSQILQTEDSGTDHECLAALKIESLSGFDHGDGTVNSRYDFDQLFVEQSNASNQATADPALLRGRQVRVVSDIYWCGGPVSRAGCAIGTRIAVERRSPDREGVLWAHEVGHTKGLKHRNVRAAVMHEIIRSNHDEVTLFECLAFRQ